MNDVLIQPFLLGISVGIFCFTYCVPFIAPYLVSEQRKLKKNFKIILEFILGRLGGYILFGAIFGYLGQKIASQTVNLILIIALMVLSVILIFYALGFLKPKGIFCSAKFIKFRTKAPILMGFLMGINICPPFLMSLAYVFTLHSIVKGIIYFLMFFLGTTVYFIPITFLGFLGKMREFRLIARIAGLVVGLAFLIYGIYYLIRGLSIIHG
jgi:sulfite exporter TauE/SafE